MADILYDTRLKSEEAPKVIILTHGDADGLVSAMIVKSFEEMENKNKTFLIMSSMDVTSEQTDKTFDYICKYTSLGSQDRVYILDTLYKDECCCENIFFHWNDKWSAAYLTLEWFKPLVEKEDCYKNLYKKLEDLAIATSYWDIFTWKNLGNSPEEVLLKKRALSINSAEKILGSEAFYKFITKKLSSKNYTEEVFDYFFLLDEAYSLKINNLYDFAKRVISDFDFRGYKLGVIYGIEGDYQSIIGDKILVDKKLNYDAVAFLNVYGTVSFRSKDDVDVSEIAQKLGMLVGYSGGGHKHAAGCRICDKDEMKKKMFEIFEHSMDKIKIL